MDISREQSVSCATGGRSGRLPNMKTILLSWLLGGLGRLPFAVLQAIGSPLGSILHVCRTRMALVTLENIRLCFPGLDEESQKALARASLRETGKTITETAFAWMASRERCRNVIDHVNGKEWVDAELAKGSGLIFIIPHLGNWEIINHYLGAEYGLTHMYRPNRSKSLDDFIQSRRQRTGTRFVETTRAGIRAQLETLRAGGTIGAMPDQEPEVYTGRFASFFGIPALTNHLIPNLARKTGSAAATAVCKRGQQGKLEIEFSPVELASLDEATAIQALNDAVETAVRDAPEQYLWSYKRFRTRPDGEAELYQFRDHPVRTLMETPALHALLWIGARLPLTTLRRMGRLVGDVLMFRNGKKARITRTNLSLCFPANRHQSLQRDSLRELGNTLMETGKIWYADQARFTRLLIAVNGAPRSNTGTLILTPPLGNREVVMRYLGEHFNVAEYYHPDNTTSLDNLIRTQRNAMGISLFAHTREARARLVRHLRDGGVVTLCPDQQPRPRGGEFIDFFGCAGLTTTALPCMLKQSGADLVFGTAIREARGFRLHFQPCDYGDSSTGTTEMLQTINRQFEEIVQQHIEQYRWSDKRFNIRPPGAAKVYR